MSHAATATRAAPIGRGHLHNALEDARDRARLESLCRAMHCTAAEVSSDGIHVDMLRVFDLMRQRGYLVSAPRRPTTQRRPGRTTWLVDITLPDNGPRFTLAFEMPDTS